MDDLSRFCCQNPDCPLHGRRDAGNLSVRDRYGKHRQIRLLYCKACDARFSERKGTPLFHSCLPRRRPSPSSSTWSRATASARPNASSASIATPSCGWPAWPASTPGTPTTNSWPFPPETREIQLDEKWSFVAKKQENCDPDDPADDHKGDWWDFVAYDAEHRLVLAVVPGARSIENAEEIVRRSTTAPAARGCAVDQRRDPAYETAIDHVYGVPEQPKPAGSPGGLRWCPGVRSRRN